MSVLNAKQIKKDTAKGFYSIHARMTVNDLKVRGGADTLTHFVYSFNEHMRYLPKKNQFSCDLCYRAEINEDWTEAKVLKLHPGSNKDPEVLWIIRRQ